MNDQPRGQPSSPIAVPAWTAALALVGMVSATTILSQFFRASTAVIGPELIRDLALSPEALGFANGAFFIALLVAQVPVGFAFDRVGPRATVAFLSVLMTAGSLLHAFAASGAGLAAARFIVGLGCAGSFMSGVVLISRWYPQHFWSTALSWMFALSQIGMFLAGLPLAYASELIGWRGAFVGMAGAAALVGLLFFLLVRNEPPGSEAAAGHSDALGVWEGVRQVLATPGVLSVFGFFFVAYASFAAVSLLWAGPYLNDVHGLDPIARGNVLLGMAAGQTLGVLAIGSLDQIFNTRKWVAVASAAVALMSLLALAAIPMSLPFAVAALMVLSVSSAYGSVLVAHIRSHFPQHLAGRGATTGNIAQVLGTALLATVTGFIPRMFASSGAGYSPLAYQCIFAVLAAALAIGLAVYLASTDSRPRPV